MSDEAVAAPPAMWGHVEKVYLAMKDTAIPEQLPGDDELVVPVWTGYTTRLFQELGIAVPYYGRVLKLLYEMGCITQLQRGGGATQSKWALLDEPNLERFVQAVETIEDAPKAPGELEQRIAAHEARLPEGVDIGRALFDLQEQINRKSDWSLGGDSDGD